MDDGQKSKKQLVEELGRARERIAELESRPEQRGQVGADGGRADVMRELQRYESLGSLAGDIAHSFNNLLMGVLGNVDMILQDLPSDSFDYACAKEIEKAGRRAAELAQEILAFAGRANYAPTWLDLSTVVAGTKDLLDVSVSSQTTLKLDLAADMPSVEADDTQLRQVLVNLAINASEAMGESGGTITIATGKARIEAAAGDDDGAAAEPSEGLYAFLEVRDTGPGIDEETRERLLEPFFTTKGARWGMGLPAVAGIVRTHGGTLKIDCPEEGGAVFRVLLPAVDVPAVEAPAKPPTAKEWRASGVALLVDDEEIALRAGRQMLEWLGFTVLTAANGQEAVSVYRDNADDIACVVLDLTMPVMGGEEALREILKIRPQAKVIIASGYAERDVASHFQEGGPAAMLHKPYQLVALATTLEQVLDG